MGLPPISFVRLPRKQNDGGTLIIKGRFRSGPQNRSRTDEYP